MDVNKKTKYITFSLDATNYKNIKAMAQRDRRKLASYIAIIIEDYINNEK